MKRSKAKKRAATKKAVKRRPKAKRKKTAAVKRKPKINIAARAKMAGVLCIRGDRHLIVKRLTKEVQDAVDAGIITAISLKGPKLVLAGGALASIKEGRFDEFVTPIKPLVKAPVEAPAPIAGAVAAPLEEEDRVVAATPAPTDEDDHTAPATAQDLSAFDSPPIQQAAQGAQH